jgi:D-glycero-D-manno-heptose 1,7-bisphosphate phosphatase
MLPQLALFLDRDGVINVDHGYVHRPEDFEFMPGIFELVRVANKQGYLVIVVTNQAGIGRGYYSESQFQSLTHWMKECFRREGALIDAVYFCPFHPEHGIGKYRRESECRKPAPGMLLQAQNDFGIELSKSILLGDKPSDMLAGRTAGVGTLIQISNTAELKTSDFVSITHLEDALPYLNKLIK